MIERERVARPLVSEVFAPHRRPAAARGPDRTRDYYVVEDQDGRRFWLFRDGLYERIEGEGDRLPRWWIQGAWG